MSLILDAVYAAVAIFASVAFYILVMLIMRNPRMPEWVHREAAAQAVALVMTVGVVAGFAYAMKLLVSLGMYVFLALGSTVAFVAIATAVICLVFQIRQRLQLADQGFSPFSSLGNRPDLPVHGAGAT
ncbi:MAG: hypothetical protein JJ900_04805 [Rhodospirillales bacterium]|nr:hypothetical protein [Rhodospirillales bacterium]MBO6786150.1 hypothetical protein [Rhodospirillales bacterium]